MNRKQWDDLTAKQHEQLVSVALFNLKRRGLDPVVRGEIEAMEYALEDALAYIEELEINVSRYSDVLGGKP
jgi:hypothetical protein